MVTRTQLWRQLNLLGSSGPATPAHRAAKPKMDLNVSLFGKYFSILEATAI